MSSATRGRGLLAALPGWLIALPAIAFVAEAAERASWASLGRDQGIFQYVAWAIGQGDVAYRDVRDVNGPVVAMVHLLFQQLGGASEHRFRVLDLVVSGVTFAFAGGCIPSLLGRGDVGARGRALARVGWALAAWAVLTAQYLAYGFWDSAQRESFFDWFVLVAIALQCLVARRPPGDRRRALALFAAGAASLVPWLGKPTFALFTLAQVAAILVEVAPLRARLRSAATFAAGGALGALGPLLFIGLRGDVQSWARITFVDVPAMYRFIWPRPAAVILGMPGYRGAATIAAVTSAVVALLVARRRLPRAAIPVAAMPVLGLASVLAQAKGFPYHFHPATLGTAFGWLVGIAASWHALAALDLASLPKRAIQAALAGVTLLVGVRTATLGARAPFPAPPPPGERDDVALESAERLAAFDRIDFFPRALRDAAAYVAAHTAPADRVQTYGMDAYVLFLARRRSATPYVYAYDLNVDAALYGSFDPGGLHPTAAEAERIRAIQADHARDLQARLERRPPAAFVFIDRSPLMSDADAVADFSAHCPESARWLSTRYRQTADFEGIRVWLRDDVTASPGGNE